jgi:hypothetical protein
MKLSWSNFKTICNNKLLSIQMDERDVVYYLTAHDGPILYRCDLLKETPASSDQTDFENNYKSLTNKPIKPKDTLGNEIVKSAVFNDATGFRFRGHSFSATVTANTTQDIDYKLNEERHINGGRLIVDNVGNDDLVTFQVIDKDNVLGFGSNVVLDEFIKDFFVPKSGDIEIQLPYPAKIIVNLYLRMKYTSTHASGCKVKCNLYLHKKT